MYERLTISSGVQAVQQFQSAFGIESSTDGVVFASPDKSSIFTDVYLPDTLRTWLGDLRLLRHIPIAYLVQDAALLPPESIRFFNIDPTWVDRVIDGVFAASDTGTVDRVFSASLLAMSRQALDSDLAAAAEAQIPGNGWSASHGLTGMLIRSELVRRWPDMVLRAYKQVVDNQQAPPDVPVLRAEAISKDLYIAVFAGTPAMVHVREPNVGVRFGVEEAVPGSLVWTVDGRKPDGTPTGVPLTVKPLNPTHRTLDVLGLGSQLGNSPRMVGLHLEQLPYVQEFKNSVDEAAGSRPLSDFQNADGSLQTLSLRRGRVLDLAGLADRLTALQNMYPGEKL